eukprot:scaffold40059_cov70-Phaeocystis_antarctica.AAC.2
MALTRPLRPRPQERLPPKPDHLRQALHTRARPPRWCYRLHWHHRCDSSGVVETEPTLRRSLLPRPTTSRPAAAPASSAPVWLRSSPAAPPSAEVRRQL